MKKIFAFVFLFAALALVPGFANAVQDVNQKPITNPAGNPIDQFTGESWVKSSDGEKLAYLFGIDSAIAVEYFINSKESANSAKAGKKPVYTLSPFERGWMDAFKNVTRSELVKEVNAWYAAHPESLEKPVMSVIWNQFVAPRLTKLHQK